MSERLDRFIKRTFHSIAGKITAAFIIMGIMLIVTLLFVLADTLNRQEENLMSLKEETDIQYIGDYISPGGTWQVRDGMLCKGFVEIGNGLKNKALIWPFEELEKKTGTFFYTFVHKDVADPEVLAEVNKTQGQFATNYLRVAGSTRDAKGNSIVGTYMSKAVSDHLGKFDIYSGEANVQGRMIYCLYRNMRDYQGNIIGAMVVGRSIEELHAQAGRARTRAISIIVVALTIALTGMLLIISKFTNELTKTKGYLQEIGTGEFPDTPLEVNTKDEIEDMANIINDMTKSLKEKQRIGAELTVARDLQANILPTRFPAYPDRTEFDVFATMTPAKEVGGDFYDYFLLDEKHIVVVIADVSGKGVAAAFFMAIAKTIIRTYARMGLKPEEVFSRANRALCKGNSACLFVTAWMGVLNLESGNLTYVNAGHNPPLLKHANGEFEYLISKPNFVLAGFDTTKYNQHEVQIEAGSKLYLYTDGVTEATSVSKELYGEDRLRDYLNGRKDEDDLTKILYGVKEDIDNFVGEAEQFDDITMVLLNYKEVMKSDGFQERTFHAVQDEMQPALGFVEETMKKAGCSVNVQMRMVMVVEELFTNICRYAYDDSGDATIALRVAKDTVTAKISDRGRPFDPTKHLDDMTIDKVNQGNLKGLGIFMVRGLVDTMDYQYSTGRNILTVTKKL